MVITWYGQACFKIQSGDFVLAIDPFSKSIGLTPPRFRADAVLITHQHEDHNNAGTIAGSPARVNSPFVITGPGEYETQGAYVRGIRTFHDAQQGRERGTNTAYTIRMEDMTLLHLGDFGEPALSSDTLEQIGSADIVLIPVGGIYTIDGPAAAKIIKQLEPIFVVPMHYAVPGLNFRLDSVTSFLKEAGAENTTPQERLTLRKRDLEAAGEHTTIVVLQPANNNP